MNILKKKKLCKSCNYGFLTDADAEFCSERCSVWLAQGNPSHADQKNREKELSPDEHWEKLPWLERRPYWVNLKVLAPKDQRGEIMYQNIIDASDRAEARRLARLAPKSPERIREFNIKARKVAV